MRCSLLLRRYSSRCKLSWFLVLLLLQGWIGLAAQNPGLTPRDTKLQNPTIQSTGTVQAESRSDAIDSFGQVEFFAPLTRRDALLGLTAWDHTLVGAFQLGASLLHLSTIVPSALGHAPVRPGGAQVLRFYGSTPRVSLDQIAKALRIDQLERQGMNLNLKSTYGNFRLQYREIFNGRSNSLGGGVGLATAAAMYTSPQFGNSKLLDFSAAALIGTGSINQMLGSGFGTSVIGGNGPALHKQAAAPTVAIKLTF